MTTVDALGTWCPTPLRLLRRRIEAARHGDELRLLADDPLIEVDLPAWCHDTGHELVSLGNERGVWTGIVRVRRT